MIALTFLYHKKSPLKKTVGLQIDWARSLIPQQVLRSGLHDGETVYSFQPLPSSEFGSESGYFCYGVDEKML